MLDLLRLAVHEAGHAVVAEALHHVIIYVELTPDGGFCRVAGPVPPGDAAVIALAGAAVRRVFGDVDQGAGGVEDWHRARRLAERACPADPDEWFAARLEEAEELVDRHRGRIALMAAELA